MFYAKTDKQLDMSIIICILYILAVHLIIGFAYSNILQLFIFVFVEFSFTASLVLILLRDKAAFCRNSYHTDREGVLALQLRVDSAFIF